MLLLLLLLGLQRLLLLLLLQLSASDDLHVLVACTQLEVQCLRIGLCQLGQDFLRDIGFTLASREVVQQLRDEADPVPQRRLALEIVVRLRQRALWVVQTEQPENATEQLARLGALVLASGFQVAADGIASQLEIVRIFFEELVAVSAPLCPSLGQFDVEEECCAESVLCVLFLVELTKEHTFEGVELCLLLRSEVVEIGIVDNIQSACQLAPVLVVALGLLTQLKEGFLNLNVRQRVDLAQLVDADLGHLVLASNMGETVDDPCRLVVTAVGV